MTTKIRQMYFRQALQHPTATTIARPIISAQCSGLPKVKKEEAYRKQEDLRLSK